MKVTKYPLSHLVIEKAGKRLIIDPGYYTFQKDFKVVDFQGADLYLITHQHADHLDPQTIKEVVKDKPIYGNQDVVNKLKEVGVEHGNIVNDGDEFEASGFKIKSFELPHFPHPLGNPMPQNTGFVIDGIFFHPGDGYELKSLKVENAALPLGHPFLSTTMVLNFAKSLMLKKIIPIHYDAYPRNPAELKDLADKLGIEVIILLPGESTEI